MATRKRGPSLPAIREPDTTTHSLAILPPSCTTIGNEKRKPPQHDSWCALHHGQTTCSCDWFEKEGRKP